MKRREEGKNANYIINIYLFLIICIYPFCMRNGFYDMSYAKRDFLYWVTGIALVAVLAVTVFEKIRDWNRKKQKKAGISMDWKQVTWTEWFLLLFGLVVVVSYIFSDYKYEVTWGTDGWHLGTVPLLLMGAMAAVTARIWKKSQFPLYCLMAASSVVFILGCCNRFSFYPIAIEPQYPTFISTLGNINWFCGYMSVIVPIGIGMYVFGDNEKSKLPWKGRLLISYCLLAFVTAFCQGSSGVFLWLGALFYAMLWIAVAKTQWLKKWFLMLALWGFAGQFVRVLKALLPEYYNYWEATLIDTNLTLVVAVCAAIVYALFVWRQKEKKDISKNLVKWIRILMLVILVVAVLAWVILSLINTNYGISFLEDNSFFIWDDSWGTDRGAEISTAMILFGDLPLGKKLIGVGADGFCAHAYATPGIAEYLSAYFSDAILTNAHSELITCLVNIGLLGTLAYVAVFVSFVVRCMKNGKEEPVFYVFALSVVCYFANNLVSFAQLYNYPYLFLILGIGCSFLNEYKQKKR